MWQSPVSGRRPARGLASQPLRKRVDRDQPVNASAQPSCLPPGTPSSRGDTQSETLTLGSLFKLTDAITAGLLRSTSEARQWARSFGSRKVGARHRPRLARVRPTGKGIRLRSAAYVNTRRRGKRGNRALRADGQGFVRRFARMKASATWAGEMRSR